MLQYYEARGDADWVKRTRSGEVSKEVFEPHLERWVETLQEEMGRGWSRRRRKHRVGIGVQRMMLGQGRCPVSSVEHGALVKNGGRRGGRAHRLQAGNGFVCATQLGWISGARDRQHSCARHPPLAHPDASVTYLQLLMTWGLTCCGPHQQAPSTSGFQ